MKNFKHFFILLLGVMILMSCSNKEDEVKFSKKEIKSIFENVKNIINTNNITHKQNIDSLKRVYAQAIKVCIPDTAIHIKIDPLIQESWFNYQLKKNNAFTIFSNREEDASYILENKIEKSERRHKSLSETEYEKYNKEEKYYLINFFLKSSDFDTIILADIINKQNYVSTYVYHPSNIKYYSAEIRLNLTYSDEYRNCKEASQEFMDVLYMLKQSKLKMDEIIKISKNLLEEEKKGAEMEFKRKMISHEALYLKITNIAYEEFLIEISKLQKNT